LSNDTNSSGLFYMFCVCVWVIEEQLNSA